MNANNNNQENTMTTANKTAFDGMTVQDILNLIADQIGILCDSSDHHKKMYELPFHTQGSRLFWLLDTANLDTGHIAAIREKKNGTIHLSVFPSVNLRPTITKFGGKERMHRCMFVEIASHDMEAELDDKLTDILERIGATEEFDDLNNKPQVYILTR